MGEGRRCSQEQVNLMITFMEEHTLFARKQISSLGPRGSEKFEALWHKLSTKLNDLGPAVKDVKFWKQASYIIIIVIMLYIREKSHSDVRALICVLESVKTWDRLRLKAKNARAQYNVDLTRTGNFPPERILHDTDERISALFGQTGSGLPSISEDGLGRKPTIIIGPR